MTYPWTRRPQAGNGVAQIQLPDREAGLRLIASRAAAAEIDVADLMAEHEIAGALPESPVADLRRLWNAVVAEVETRG